MKKKLLLLILSAVLILSGCNSAVPANDNADESSATTTATTTTTTTVTTTTAVTTLIPDDPAVTTTAPQTQDDPPVPVTTMPSTTEKMPETEDTPLTEDKPTTDALPVWDKGSEAELSALLLKYPIVTAPDDALTSGTLTQLIESASRSFSESTNQSITASGSFAVSVPLLGEMARQTLTLSYLTNGTDYQLTSKITENNKVIDDSQVYQNGWLYNTSTTTQNGKVSDTDHYKIKMSSEEFEQNVLANTLLNMDTVRAMAELFANADHIKAGMMADGSCAIVAKGYDFAAMIQKIDPDGNMAQYVDANSFSNMETALVIDPAGNLAELYVKLPLGIQLEGIPMTMTIGLTVTPAIPDAITITTPAGGEAYVERTIDEVYGDEDDFVFDWFDIL